MLIQKFKLFSRIWQPIVLWLPGDKETKKLAGFLNKAARKFKSRNILFSYDHQEIEF